MQVTARELLELEARLRLGACTDSDFDRWKQLAMQVFGRKNMGVRERKSFRIPTNGEAQIRHGGTHLTCSLREVSRLSLTLSGDSIEHLQVNNRLVIDALVISGTETPVSLRGRVARLRLWDDEEFSIGVELDMNVPSTSIDVYYSGIFYPIYLRHLEQIAKGCEEETTSF